MIYRALELKSGISTSGRSSIRSGSYRSSEPVEDIKETGSTYNRSDSRYHLSGSQSRYGSRGTDSGIGEYAGRSALNRSILDSPEKSFSAPLPKYENSTPGYGGYPREKASLTPGFPNPPSSTPFSSSSSQKRRPPPPPPPPAPAAPQPKDTEVRVLALYAFSGQTDGDLSFSKGDVITVVKKTDSQDDWWDGSLNGKVGQFPANYVKLL
ncbi:LAS seventeen-binding protein 3 [Zancudomyces culisetae]|uniref:LAS seventeen-binding protein 3 n=1 Tax=Zancudomyces culisetae TaxID=1213189 RepID=A0A1R1PYP9_ZANCU|nr:LAS seventeen-binding protein 3 [Zancudomyces culisetae]|eukprot:OMH86051.1 LAS seventeen-binding protein 3 [Zancudomyces culisetae]